jgi:uncharacterized membrane protein YphA (DoxX/SURF4 family)
VLLRIAIGWHFQTEGWEKVNGFLKGKPFNAEPFLRASTGPLSPYFRGLVPDVNGLAKLDPDRLKSAWAEDVERIAAHFDFDSDQRAKAKAELQDSEHFADVWFHDRENLEKRQKYYHDLAAVQKVEKEPLALSYERERAAERRKDLDNDRKDLLKEIDAQGSALREAVTKLAAPDQLLTAGAYVPPRTQLDTINQVTTFGVFAIGLCLILGLFTRLAALGGAAFLAQVYLCMPPWPGLPLGPKAEGHYYIVDKNLVEMLACLALAFLPTGQWVGIDALLFGRFVRARAARRAARAERDRAGRERAASSVR